jgi:hypothetical protein
MPKRPKDVNQLAKLVADIATGSTSDDDLGTEELVGNSGKNAAAVALGREGGLKGGKARAQSLTPEKRQEIARKAAKKRWHS